MSLKLIAIDDDPQMVEFVTEALAGGDLKVQGLTDPHAGLEMVLRERPDVVLLDLLMPGMSGMQVLERIMESVPDTEVVLLTGNYSTDSAVEAIKKGASDYLEKPISPNKLRQRMEQILREAKRRQEAARLEEGLSKVALFEGMVGHSQAMQAVFARIRRIAPHFQTVLVSGESGTGKELVARALHRQSPVSSGPFVVCNCSAIPETLVESQLFGHVKGAFTGAAQTQVGLFESAQGGTVFLDEIGEMPLGAQAKLLRVLQNREVQRVGSPTVHKLDVRVVAATNRDLRAMVAAKQFREDLYYRLSVVEVALPPLRNRREDIPLLTRHFLNRFANEYQKPIRGLTRRAEDLLAAYPWPGNVRELENVLTHACMEMQGDTIDLRDLPPRLLEPVAPEKTFPEATGPIPQKLDELIRFHAKRTLQMMGGNKVKTAEVLGVSRSRLYSLLADSDVTEQAG